MSFSQDKQILPVRNGFPLLNRNPTLQHQHEGRSFAGEIGLISEMAELLESTIIDSKSRERGEGKNFKFLKLNSTDLVRKFALGPPGGLFLNFISEVLIDKKPCRAAAARLFDPCV